MPTGRYVAVVAAPEAPLARAGRGLERHVFELSFGNDAATMATEYGPYDRNSLFFVVLDRRTGDPAGVARMIHGPAATLKTIADAPAALGVPVPEILTTHGLAGAAVWDWATLAVAPDHRHTSEVTLLLFRTFLLEAARDDVRHAVAMLDHAAHRTVRRLGVPTHPLAGSGPITYLGSPNTQAVHLIIPSLIPALHATTGRIAPLAHRLATGAGLDNHILNHRSAIPVRRPPTALPGTAPP